MTFYKERACGKILQIVDEFYTENVEWSSGVILVYPCFLLIIRML